MRIWGRGVDHAQFTPSRRSDSWRRSLGYAKDEPVLLFFGRLVQEKGLDTFVATVKALEARGHAIRPLFVGDGPARAWLEAQLPAQPSPAISTARRSARRSASADVLINPSVTEAFGNVNLEAMAAGLAIVSADVGSARALIENGRKDCWCRPGPSAPMPTQWNLCFAPRCAGAARACRNRGERRL